MSFELFDGETFLSTFATNKGLDELDEWVGKTKYTALQEFVEEGRSEKLEALRKDVSAAIKSEEAPLHVHSTLMTLDEALKKAKDTVMIVS